MKIVIQFDEIAQQYKAYFNYAPKYYKFGNMKVEAIGRLLFNNGLVTNYDNFVTTIEFPTLLELAEKENENV